MAESRMEEMHMENQYTVLVEKHRSIEARLAAELKRPLPDSLAVQRLKREKLLLKEEIVSWEGLIRAVRTRPVRQSGALHS